VVLTGDGGDESFGGYARYRVNGIFGTLGIVPAPLLVAAARAGGFATAPLGARSRLHRRFQIAEGLFGHDRDGRYVAQMTSLGDVQRERLMGDRNATAPYLLDILRAGPDDPIDRLLRADLLTYLPEDLLVKMDRATMANSLEARSPLLDHKLVEFAARLPIDQKIDGKTTKVLLRSIAKRLMPAAHVDRPKMGFAAPIVEWFQGDLGDRFIELVLAPDAASRDYLDPMLAREMIERHRSGLERFDGELWSLLMFELWARRWLPARVPVT
jgi:asparagine synthase (glutamine-hydrolysing)